MKIKINEWNKLLKEVVISGGDVLDYIEKNEERLEDESKNINKILLDRKNQLKSELSQMNKVKLTKIINFPKIHMLEERLRELELIKESLHGRK